MRDVTIKTNDLTKIYGSSASLTAQLLDNNTPLSGKSIVISIHGVDYPRTTGSDGKVSLNINLQPGTYQCSIRFLGDSTYNPASRQVVVRVVSNTVPQQNLKGKGNYFEVNKIPLHVTMSGGFEVTPGQNIKETQLLHDDGNMNTPTFYFNSGFDGDEFEISVLMKESYFYNGQQVMAYLNAWNKMNTVVSVVTDAMIIPNGKYTMQIKKKSQTLENRSIWKLRFKQYYENSLSFESLYETRASTLSSVDKLLLKQVNGINEKSSPEVITALQRKLQSIGYWSLQIDGYSAGSWGGVPNQVFYFARNVMKVNKMPGVDGVDYETITAIIDYSYGDL